MPRPKPEGQERIDNDFAYHPATEITGPLHDEVRVQARNLASKWNKALPAGRHKSLALTALEEAMHWANSAIACDSTGAAPAPEDVEPDEPEVVEAAPAPAAKKAAPAKASAKKAVSRSPRKTATAPAAPVKTATVTPIKSSTRRPRAQRAAQG